MGFILAFALSGTDKASGFAKTDQDCRKCHTLSAEQAQKTLESMIPNLKILAIQDSAIDGLWEIAIESGGKKGIVYLDYGKKHIIAGNIFALQTKENLTQESFQRINRIDVAQIPLGDALLMGEKTAKHKIIVFDDPD